MKCSLYTGGGPEHRSNYTSVNIALIAFQKYLNLDLLIAACTAPGHPYTNPPEKVNCILNLGLYSIGCMRSVAEDPEFERKLGQCSVRALLEKVQLSISNFLANAARTTLNRLNLILPFTVKR